MELLFIGGGDLVWNFTMPAGTAGGMDAVGT